MTVVGNPAIRVFLLEGAALVFSFAAGAFISDRPAYLREPEGILRLAIPVLVGLAVLVLRNMHARRSERKQYDSTLDVVLAFGCAFLVEALLRRYLPLLALTRGWAPTQGGLAGMMDLAASRALFGVDRTQDELKLDTRLGGKAFLTAAYWVLYGGRCTGYGGDSLGVADLRVFCGDTDFVGGGGGDS